MKKVFLVGINYIGTPNELRGCINDINNMQQFLKNGRNCSNFSKLSDDNPDTMPTKSNIIAGLQNLVKDAKPGDELWFHFSGHGVLQRDRNGDEESGFDSCICPIDFQTSGFITDDTLRSILNIPVGVTLYVILDCCHSGTGCDLRYRIEDYSYANSGANMQKYDSTQWTLKQTMYEFKNYKKTNGDIFLISGCKDNQTSADAFEDNKATGALTYCLLKLIRNNYGNCKWKDLLKDLNGLLKTKGYTQRPVLTTGRFINTNNFVFDKNSSAIEKVLNNPSLFTNIMN